MRYQVDPRGLGGDKLPTASYSLPNLKKRSIFCDWRGIENFRRRFSTRQRPNVFVSDAWPAPAAYHRPFCAHCCDHRSDFIASRWFCRSMSVEGTEFRRFGLTFIWWSFSQGDLGPTSAQEYFVCFFSEELWLKELYWKIFVLIASGTKIFWRVSLKFKLFLQHRISIDIGLRCCRFSWVTFFPK